MGNRLGNDRLRMETHEISHASDRFVSKLGKVLRRRIQPEGLTDELEHVFPVSDLPGDTGGLHLAEQGRVEAGLDLLLGSLGYETLLHFFGARLSRFDHLP